MPSLRINKSLKSELYFLTFVIKNHINLFKDQSNANLIIKSFKYCQSKYGLKIYSFVIMLDHIHLLSQCPDMITFIKEFKSYISKVMKNKIFNSNLKPYFKDNSGKYTFWESNNWPILIETDYFIKQKINYIHENPTRKGYVEREEDWKYSSARNYYLGDHSLIQIEVY